MLNRIGVEKEFEEWVEKHQFFAVNVAAKVGEALDE